MYKLLRYFLDGCKYFLIQTLLEIIFIVGLMYLGFSYSGLEVGREHFYEVLVGVLGYHGLFKLIIYLIPYLLFFIGICYLGKYQNHKYFSRINALLSIILPIAIKILKDLTFKEMSSVFIATFLSLLIILIYSQYKAIQWGAFVFHSAVVDGMHKRTNETQLSLAHVAK